MNSVILLVFGTLYVAAWVCGVVNGIFLERLFRSRHPEVAKTIFPTFTENSISSGLARLRYIATRKYCRLDDSQFVARVDQHRIIELVSFSVVFLGLVIGTVLVIVSR